MADIDITKGSVWQIEDGMTNVWDISDLQLHGGYGYMESTPSADSWRDADRDITRFTED
jgi:hypothetical protein